ncbi:MAG: UbiA family prenyltransferase [Candidatus Hodarchaeota archaeon]
MQNTVLYRLRFPNIVGSSLFAMTGLILNLRDPIKFDMFNAILIILSMIFFNIFIWISNDYYDAPYDADDEYKKARNVFCGNPDSRDYKIGKTFIWFSVIAGLVSGLLAGLLYFMFVVAGILLAYLYNSPIFRAKSRVGFDWVFHVVWFQITFLPLYLYIFGFDVIWGFESKNIQFYSIFLFISLVSLLAQINHQIPDYSLDLQTKQRTTVVVLGIDTTVKLRYIFYFFIAFAAIVLCLLKATLIALLMMVVYTAYLLKTDTKKAADVPLAWLYFFIADYLVISPFLSFIITIF